MNDLKFPFPIYFHGRDPRSEAISFYGPTVKPNYFLQGCLAYCKRHIIRSQREIYCVNSASSVIYTSGMDCEEKKTDTIFLHSDTAGQ